MTPPATRYARAAALQILSIPLGIAASNLKTALCGTYHAFDFVKYAPRYLAEAQYRFNKRFDLRSILPRLVRAAAVTLPCAAPLIRAAEFVPS
jgi:hypothetical protein